jgi:hypothetical protein
MAVVRSSVEYEIYYLCAEAAFSEMEADPAWFAEGLSYSELFQASVKPFQNIALGAENIPFVRRPRDLRSSCPKTGGQAGHSRQAG